MVKSPLPRSSVRTTYRSNPWYLIYSYHKCIKYFESPCRPPISTSSHFRPTFSFSLAFYLTHHPPTSDHMHVLLILLLLHPLYSFFSPSSSLQPPYLPSLPSSSHFNLPHFSIMALLPMLRLFTRVAFLASSSSQLTSSYHPSLEPKSLRFSHT